MKVFKCFIVLFCATMVFVSCEKNEPNVGTENGHEWVELGLPSGTKWATCNIGATSPEKYGNYYAWGETEPKGSCLWDNYKWKTKDFNSEFTKYNPTDGLTILEPADDAATVNWGENWSIPSPNDWLELLYNCTCVSVKKNGVECIEVKGDNGNSIFLCVDMSYWTNSVLNEFGARSFIFDSEIIGYVRYIGLQIRPVFKKK